MSKHLYSAHSLRGRYLIQRGRRSWKQLQLRQWSVARLVHRPRFGTDLRAPKVEPRHQTCELGVCKPQCCCSSFLFIEQNRRTLAALLCCLRSIPEIVVHIDICTGLGYLQSSRRVRSGWELVVRVGVRSARRVRIDTRKTDRNRVEISIYIYIYDRIHAC